MNDVEREQTLADYGVSESDVMTDEHGREYILTESEDDDGVRFTKVFI